MDFSLSDLLPDISFKTSRSGGKGGQNVNKVSSKVELNFNFEVSKVFTDSQKNLLRQKLTNKLTADGEIQLISEEERSQYLNKERTLQKLLLLLKNSLHVSKARKATKPKKSSVEKRLQSKQLNAIKKLNRSRSNFD